MPLGGLAAASGRSSLPAMIVAGVAGTLVGSAIAYGLARIFGEPLLLGPGRYVGISPSHVRLARRWFDRFGSWAVLLGRDIPVLRTYISFPAGLAPLPFGRFCLLTFAGSVPWCVGLAYLGYAAGTDLHTVSSVLTVVGIVAVLIVAVLLVRWWFSGRTGAKGAALPGPDPGAV